MSNVYKKVTLTPVVRFDDVMPLASIERAIDSALTVLSCEGAVKEAKALAAGARGAVSAFIAREAIGGNWKAMRVVWMNEVEQAATAAGVPFVKATYTNEDGKEVKGWRESSTLATYASNGNKIEAEYSNASEQHARLLALAKAQHPDASDRELYAMVPPNPFRGVEGLGKLYRVACEYAKAREEGTKVKDAAIQSLVQAARETVSEQEKLAKHAERVANDPDAVVASYLDQIQTILNRAAADGAAIVSAVSESLVDSLTTPQDEELARLEALVSAETQAPPVNLSKAA